MPNRWTLGPSGLTPEAIKKYTVISRDSEARRDFFALGTYILAVWFLVISVTSQIVDGINPFTAKILYVIAVVSAAIAYVGLVALRASWQQIGVLTRHPRDDATEWGLLALGFGAWASMHPTPIIVTTCEAFLLVYLVWPAMFRWGGTMGWRHGEYIAPLLLTAIPAVSLAHGAAPFETWQGVTFAVITAHSAVRNLRFANSLAHIWQIVPITLALSIICDVYLHAMWIPLAAIAAVWVANRLVPRWLPLTTWVSSSGRSLQGAGFAIGTLIVVLLFINTIPEWDPIHYGYFLYPSRDAFWGKTPLVDINFQYGYMNIYVISVISYALFHDINYVSSAISVNLLNICLSLVILFIAKRREHARISLFIFLLFLVFGKFSQQDSPDRFPSVGFMRFGPSFIAVALLGSGNFRGTWRKRIIQSILIGLSSLYSFECLFYVFTVIFVDIFSGFIYNGRETLKNRIIVDFIIPVGFMFGSIFTWLFGAMITTVAYVGEWPDWRHYTQFLTLYSGGFGFWQPSVVDPWLPILIISVLGLCWGIDVNINREYMFLNTYRDAMLPMVGALGIAQFIYFIYRPHPFNLYHIMWPSLIIIYWYIEYVLREKSSLKIDSTTILVGVIMIIIVMLSRNTIVSLGNVASRTGLGWAARQSIGIEDISMPWGSPARPPDTDIAYELQSMFDKFPQNQKRIPMIVDIDILDSGLLQTRKINWFPISYDEQDGLIPLTKESMNQAGTRLEVGAMLIIERGLPRRRPATYGPAFEALCRRGVIVDVLRLRRMSLARLELSLPYGSTDLCNEESAGGL